MQRVPVLNMVNQREYARPCKHKEFALWMIRVKQTRDKTIQERIRRQSIGAEPMCSNDFFCRSITFLISYFRVWIWFYNTYSYFILFLWLINPYPFSWVSEPISAKQIPSVWWRGEKDGRWNNCERAVEANLNLWNCKPYLVKGLLTTNTLTLRTGFYNIPGQNCSLSKLTSYITLTGG